MNIFSNLFSTARLLTLGHIKIIARETQEVVVVVYRITIATSDPSSNNGNNRGNNKT